MKTSIKALSLFILVAISSCSKEFLDEKPHDMIDLETFYKSSVNAEIGLTGAYAKIIGIYTMNNLMWFAVSADEFTAANHAQSGMGAGDHRDLASTSLYGMAGCYTEPYVGIVNINMLLKKVPEISDNLFAPGRKSEIMGEAYFLRGYAYYMLAMAFRDVPLQLDVPTSSNPNDNFLEKSPQSEILDQALKDFDMAIGLLPDKLTRMTANDIRGRGSKWAAKGFKARIYMWREDWQSAKKECDDIINSGQFAMATRWINIFAGENNDAEVIWQSQGQSREQYDFMGVYRWFCDADPDAPAPPFMVEKKLTDKFSQPYKDVRLEYSVRAISRKAGFSDYGGRNVKHFHVPSGLVVEGVSDESRDKNFPLMRLAEVKLMKAEAIIQSNYALGAKQEALDILNELRKRAADAQFVPREKDTRYDYDKNTGCIGIPLLTTEELNIQALKDEKYRELAMEGVRWFDLLRWSKKEDNYQSVMALVKAANVDRLYMAIPQQQIDANKGHLTQNPGY